MAANGTLEVSVAGPQGLHFVQAEGGTLVTAVESQVPAAAAGLGPGWRVAAAGDQELSDISARKAAKALQRALDAAIDNRTPVRLRATPPVPIVGGSAKKSKRGNKTGKGGKGAATAAATTDDATARFHAAASRLTTMDQALRLIEGSNADAIDPDRKFSPPPQANEPGGRTPILAHVLSLVSREVGLLGGVKLGLAPGTARHLSTAMNGTGVGEALAVASWLATAVTKPSGLSRAGYSPVFYATSLREFSLCETLLVARGLSPDEPGPGPLLPTPLHILLQLPDERTQLARAMLRRRPSNATALQLSEVAGEFRLAAQYSFDMSMLLLGRPKSPSRRTEPSATALEREAATALSPSSSAASATAAFARSTVSMVDLASGVHGWQLPFLVLLLAHSRDAPKLVATVDAWGRNVAHMAARSGNDRAIRMLPLVRRRQLPA